MTTALREKETLNNPSLNGAVAFFADVPLRRTFRKQSRKLSLSIPTGKSRIVNLFRHFRCFNKLASRPGHAWRELRFPNPYYKKQQHSWNTMLNPVAANKYDSSLQTCPTSYFAGSPGVFGRLLAVSLGQLNAFPLLPHCNEHHHQRGRALAV